MPGLLVLLIFVSIALAGYGLAGILGARDKARQALLGRVETVSGPARSRQSIMRDQRLSTIALFDAFLERLPVTVRLVRLIRSAGLNNRVGEVLLYVALLGALGALGGVLFTGSRLVGAGVGVVGAALPLLIVRRWRNKRMRMFSEQLPDALDLVRAALQAGHSFGTALAVVANEFPDPIAEEFRVVTEEMRLGLPLRDALLNLRARVDDENVPILVVGVLVVQEVGGNMAEVLDNVSYTIRERFKLLRDADVMTAQGRLSANVLCALPIVVSAAMYFISPTYFRPMLEKPAGRAMIAYAAFSVALGYWFIRKMVRIRV